MFRSHARHSCKPGFLKGFRSSIRAASQFAPALQQFSLSSLTKPLTQIAQSSIVKRSTSRRNAAEQWAASPKREQLTFKPGRQGPHSWCDQAPANRESRAVRAADVNIIVQTPDRGLMSDCIEQYIIRLGITVKVGCSYQCPAAGKDWPSSGPQ